MKSTSSLSVGRIARALGYSRQGLVQAWRQEAAFRQELMLFAILAPVTLCLRLPMIDTVLLLVLMAIVLAAELLNSGLEALVDKTSPEHHPLAGKAKDCGSAAVLMVMVAMLGAWAALAGPTLLQRLV